MMWFRRPRRVNVGTYTAPTAVPPPAVEAQIEDGVLVAMSAARLAITNQLIVRSLRDGKDYDEQKLRLAVTAEILELAREKEDDAQRIRTLRQAVGDRPGQASNPTDFRTRDALMLERRATVSAGLAARLTELSTDPKVVGELAARAHSAFLDEFQVSVVQGARAFQTPQREAPLGSKDRARELRGLVKDLEALAVDRSETERLRRATGD
jgi:hypothetical protein